MQFFFHCAQIDSLTQKDSIFSNVKYTFFLYAEARELVGYIKQSLAMGLASGSRSMVTARDLTAP